MFQLLKSVLVSVFVAICTSVACGNEPPSPYIFINTPSTPLGACFSPDSTKLAVLVAPYGRRPPTIYVANSPHFEELKPVPLSDELDDINAISFAPEGDAIFFGTLGGDLGVLALKKAPSARLSLTANEYGRIEGIAVGSKTLVVTTEASAANVWPLSLKKCRRTMRLDEAGSVPPQMARDGKTAYVASLSTLYSWDTETGRTLGKYMRPGTTEAPNADVPPSDLFGIALAPNGKRIAVYCSDVTVTILDAPALKITRTFAPATQVRPYIRYTAFVDDKTVLVCGRGRDAFLTLYDVDAGNSVGVFPSLETKHLPRIKNDRRVVDHLTAPRIDYKFASVTDPIAVAPDGKRFAIIVENDWLCIGSTSQ